MVNNDNAKSIDTALYSRQLGAFGFEAMRKLIKMRVLISGMQGTGVEAAKNIILAGPASVSIHDDTCVRMRDLGSNFYLSESDVGLKTRAEAILNQLRTLNDYVDVSLVSGTLTEELLSQYHVVVLCGATEAEVLKVNDFCRSHMPQIMFITADVMGVSARVFVDCGDTPWTVRDKDGEECKSVILAGVTQENPVVVCTHTDRILPFSDGDYVTFSEVEGMTPLNSLPPTPIIVKGKHQFEIAVDGTDFPAYTGQGLSRQVKMPTMVTFNSYRRSVCHPAAPDSCMMMSPDLSKIEMYPQLHVAMTAVQLHRNLFNCLPGDRQEQCVERVGALAEGIVKAMKLQSTQREKLSKDCVGGYTPLSAIDPNKLTSDDLRAYAEHAIINLVCDDITSTIPSGYYDNCIAPEKVDLTVVKFVSMFAECHLSPMAAFVGGIVAQEIVKFTGKYMPLRGWLYFDCFECLPEYHKLSPDLTGDGDPSNFSPTGTRYDDQIVIFGKLFQKHLQELNVFLVGAGALGCEFLKAFSVMGISCSSQGVLTVTDMDNIEISNLNRQFLFRKAHVGLSKSKTAAESAKCMNTALNVVPLENRLGADTEDVFHDEFWERQHLVINALDNVPARQYVDGRCVLYGLPLLESGTLGTKANSQTIIPFLTQSYNDSHDPPDENIPLCTLKHFPNEVVHTIEWARDIFEGTFCDTVRSAKVLVEDPEGFFARLAAESTVSRQRLKLESVKKTVTAYIEAVGEGEGRVTDASACVTLAVRMFFDFFNTQIRQLLHAFPPDHRNASDGTKFWSGPKRCPLPVEYTPSGPQLDFVIACANLLAFTMGIPQCTDRQKMAEASSAVTLGEAEIKKVIIKIDENATEDSVSRGSSLMNDSLTGDDDAQEVEKLKQELLSILQKHSTMEFTPADFEKDDDTNFHVEFIHSCAFMRSANYSISTADHTLHKTKMIAGKIVPAVATTTSMVTGCVCIELYKLVALMQIHCGVSTGQQLRIKGHPSSSPVEDNSLGVAVLGEFGQRTVNFGGAKNEEKIREMFKNGFMNLGLPIWLFSEPLSAIKNVDKDYDPVACGPVRAQPPNFTTWNTLCISLPDATVDNLCTYISEKFDADVCILSVGNACLYNSFLPAHNKQRAKAQIKKLTEDITKTKLPAGRKYVILEASCSDRKDQVDVLIPSIKLSF